MSSTYSAVMEALFKRPISHIQTIYTINTGHRLSSPLLSECADKASLSHLCPRAFVLNTTVTSHALPARSSRCLTLLEYWWYLTNKSYILSSVFINLVLQLHFAELCQSF